MKKQLYTVETNGGIIIRPADKGPTTPIMNKCDYINEAKNNCQIQITQGSESFADLLK